MRRLYLIREGRPACAIWWIPADEGDQATRYAAEQLSHYVSRMAGRTLPVRREPLHVTLDSNHFRSGLILQPLDQTASHWAEPEPPRWQAEGRRALEELAARRSSENDAFAFTPLGDGALAILGSRPRATLYGAYSLLNALGVSFFAPRFGYYDDQAERIPNRRGQDLWVPLETHFEEAGFPLRRLHVEEGWSHDPHSLIALVDWMAKSKFNTLVVPVDYQHLGRTRWDDMRSFLLPELRRRDLVLEVGSHGYENFVPYAAYSESHPEWFWGERKNQVFVVSARGLLEQFTANVLHYLSEHPEIDILDVWPPDSARWAPKDLELFKKPENISAHVLNATYDKVKEAFPHVTLAHLAYHATDVPDVPLPKDVIVDFADYNRSYSERLYETGYEANRRFARQLQQWVETHGNVGYYSYYKKYSWHSMPNNMPGLVADELRWLKQLGVRAVGMYSEPANWMAFELQHWTFGRSCWQPPRESANAGDEYASLRFPKVHALLRQYIDRCERAGMLLFPSPHGAFSASPPAGVDQGRWNTERVARLRAAGTLYAEARSLLDRARATADLDQGTAMILDRLGQNLQWAQVSVAEGLATAEGKTDEAARCREELRRLADTYFADGILEHDLYLCRRFVSQEETSYDDWWARRNPYRHWIM